MENVKKSYYENGNIKSEYHYKNDKLHRDNGPANIYYYQNGNIKIECWYKNDKCHRDNGPAIIHYNENQNIINEKFYLNGEKVDELKILVNM